MDETTEEYLSNGFQLCQLALEVNAACPLSIFVSRGDIALLQIGRRFLLGQHDVQYAAPLSQYHCFPAKQTA